MSAAPITDPTAPISAREARIIAAQNPQPAAIERGPIARLHWRHGLDVDPALAAVTVDTPDTPREWSALLAETHASLLDPAGVQPLPSPSPLGREVSAALTAHESWPTLQDAARASPMLAREATTQIASVILDALKRAGAKPATDTRRSLADLEATRAALERARALEKSATTPEEKREALRKRIEAQAAEERAKSACAVDDGIASRVAETLDGKAAGAAIAACAERAEERADAVHAFSAALGTGAGVGGTTPIPDDVVRMLTPHIAAMLRAVGALRKALSKGRAARHVRGLEGMIGLTTGGYDRVADLTAIGLASLGGHLGDGHAALTRLSLAESRAVVVEKGGGIARNGDVVVVVDQSGSMQGAREEWAGALALAVLLEARSDGRSSALVTYNGAVRASVVIDTPASLALALRALTCGSTGDNNEHAALNEAARVLGRMPHGGNPADVLLITDGHWVASNVHGVNLDRARLRGVFIGGSAPEGAGFASAWEVRAVEGKPGEDAAVTIAESIV